MKNILLLFIHIGLLMAGSFGECALGGLGCDSEKACVVGGECEKADANSLEGILGKLGEATDKLEQFSGKIEYDFIQEPELLADTTIRKGEIMYLKRELDGERRSFLRVNFETLQQQDLEEEKHREYYLFDGVKLTRVDYELKQVNVDYMAKEDEPVEVFELLDRHFPIIGFSGTSNLEKEFDIKLAESEDVSKYHHLSLDVKADSRYKEEYKKVDFYIDKKSSLPMRIVTVSTEGDIYDIKFSGLNTEKKLVKADFEVETPPDFVKNENQLKDNSSLID